jgi:hypothetical protein
MRVSISHPVSVTALGGVCAAWLLGGEQMANLSTTVRPVHATSVQFA